MTTGQAAGKPDYALGKSWAKENINLNIVQ
jgi:hypothetical protein